MSRLQRIHAGVILGATILRALRKIAFTLVLMAAFICAANWSFGSRPATLLTACVILWGVRKIARRVGELLGPPEPTYSTGARVEKRRVLRRAGMLGGR
jgi:hypothetical protein